MAPGWIMTAPLPHRETGQSRVAVATGSAPQLDYSKVREYWKSAQPSMLGPYMMEGFGFPTSAGRFRFRGELSAVAKAIQNIEPSTSVLDLGSGVGVWAEYFAQRFAKVVAVEASSTLFAALKDRCSPYPNVTLYNRDVLSFEPKSELGSTGGGGPAGGFGLVFLGGLMMYLNDRDIQALLRNLIPRLEPDAIVLCRESTILHGVKAIQGDYQVVYRSVETYRSILADAGFNVVSVQANTAYINVQMACELIKKWKALVPERFRCLPVVGHLAYWGFRLGNPWNTRLIPWLMTKMGREFPLLTNHFFVLRPDVAHRAGTAGQRDTSLRGTRIEKERFVGAR